MPPQRRRATHADWHPWESRGSLPRRVTAPWLPLAPLQVLGSFGRDSPPSLLSKLSSRSSLELQGVLVEGPFMLLAIENAGALTGDATRFRVHFVLEGLQRDRRAGTLGSSRCAVLARSAPSPRQSLELRHRPPEGLRDRHGGGSARVPHDHRGFGFGPDGAGCGVADAVGLREGL